MREDWFSGARIKRITGRAEIHTRDRVGDNIVPVGCSSGSNTLIGRFKNQPN